VTSASWETLEHLKMKSGARLVVALLLVVIHRIHRMFVINVASTRNCFIGLHGFVMYYYHFYCIGHCRYAMLIFNL